MPCKGQQHGYWYGEETSELEKAATTVVEVEDSDRGWDAQTAQSDHFIYMHSLWSKYVKLKKEG